MEDVIIYEGRKNYDEVIPYFRSSNIGVSFVPIKDYFNCQPPTKTFEYILSGMVCIATATEENKKLINDNNGILFNDNPEDFSFALKKVYLRKNKYNTKIITDTLKENNWETIVRSNLSKYFLALLK